MALPFSARADSMLTSLAGRGELKELRTIEGPMGPVVRLRGYGDCVCFCSNNYLGLANHPAVVEAGIKGLRDFGAGTASVRFICGTFSPHEVLERSIADFMGTDAAYTFVSAWNAAEALFPTLCEPGDLIISDELNHACIIDAVRLAAVIKKGIHKAVYKNNLLTGPQSLTFALEQAAANPDVTGQIWVVTDGVFSMEGSIADLAAMRRICDSFNALLVVDDSHGHGVMGKTGRGTHEHFGMLEGADGFDAPELEAALLESSLTSIMRSALKPNRVDMFTGTLGKALGGGAGGFVAGPQRAIDLLVQRGRPTLFSNALPVTIACSAAKAIEILLQTPSLVQTLRNNCAYARTKIRAAGFEVLESPTAICPIIVHDTARAIKMSKRLLELGVFVIGFGFPVVPEGHARLRVQISAAHTTEHIDKLVSALKML